MFGALLGGAGLGAIGIGALIGGLGAKQRGGNFLKGALSGAALGGITGGLGAKYGGGEGGIFGFGKKLLPNFLAMSGIGMGTEMLGQQEANRKALEGRRRMFDEEEEERIARLSRIAGYDVADSSNFLTPQSYFGAAEGGMISRPGYYPGGIASVEDDPMDAVNVQEMQMDPGTMGPGELVEEFDFMEEAGSGGDESGWYEMFFNEFGRDPVNIEELQLFIDQSDISDTDVAGIGQGPMMAAEGGSIERPGYFPGGLAVAMAKLAQQGKAEDAIKGSDVVDEEIYMTEDEDENGGGIWDSITETILTPSGSNPTPGLREGDPQELSKEGEQLEKIQILQADESDLTKEGKQLKEIMDIQSDTGTKGKFVRISEDILKSLMLGPLGKIFNQKNPKLMELMGEDFEFEPGPAFSHPPMNRAQGGGIGDLDLRGGGHSIGPGTGTSDDIPAMLSDGEFVVTAKAVENLGGGDRMEGARRMYSMMNQLDPQSQAPAEMNYVGRG